MADEGQLDSSTQPNGTSTWFVKWNDEIIGPLSETEMREQLDKTLNPALQVKQGNSEWHPAQIIRDKINKLAVVGAYLRGDGQIKGPFTLAKTSQLLQQYCCSSIAAAC